MVEPLITVIIPTYNRAYCIKRSIQSVLDQTYTNLELLIIDDHSMDNTEEVVRAIKDDRIKYVKLEKNLGVGGARNYGIRHARGELIAFQDSDDQWYPQKLEYELNEMRRDDCGMVFCKYELSGARKGVIPADESFDVLNCEHGLADYLIMVNRIGAPTVLIRKALLEQYGGFNENMKTLEDWEFAIKMSMVTKVGFVNQVLMCAHVEDKGTNSILGKERLDALIIIIEKYWKSFSNKALFGDILHSIFNHIAALPKEQQRKYISRLIRYFTSEKTVLSVIVPVFNVEKYLVSCLDSILKQPMANIEVICVNDGSSDNSLNILYEYKQRDARIKVVNKENSGYGDSVNEGLKIATGSYISIIESDDLVCENALADLCAVALCFDAEIVKGNYNLYYSANDLKQYYGNINDFPDYTLLSDKEREGLFFIAPSIWSGVYKREFLEKNKISFLKTPGASYQDTSFAFKVWACARRVVLIREPIIEYRQDNMNSSSNESKKIFNICSEYDEIEQFLKSRRKEYLYPFFAKAKFISYAWNANRLNPENQMKFWLCVQKDFKKLLDEGYLIRNYWSDHDWDTIQNIVNNIGGFCGNIIDTKLGYSFNVLDVLKYVTPLYIYGAGIVGQRLLKELQNYGVSPSAFVVSDDKISLNEKNDFRIISLKNSDPDGLIIIGVSEKYKEEIIATLHVNHHYNYILKNF